MLREQVLLCITSSTHSLLGGPGHRHPMNNPSISTQPKNPTSDLSGVSLCICVSFINFFSFKCVCLPFLKFDLTIFSNKCDCHKDDDDDNNDNKDDGDEDINNLLL